MGRRTGMTECAAKGRMFIVERVTPPYRSSSRETDAVYDVFGGVASAKSSRFDWSLPHLRVIAKGFWVDPVTDE